MLWINCKVEAGRELLEMLLLSARDLADKSQVAERCNLVYCPDCGQIAMLVEGSLLPDADLTHQPGVLECYFFKPVVAAGRTAMSSAHVHFQKQGIGIRL
jgi:hypothetical protein